MIDDKLKIFVVDDDPLARLVLADQLRQEPRYEVREFGDAGALLDAMADAPDIVLLDIEMPGMNGIDACRALREAGNDHVRVLFVSARDDLDTRLAAYHAGGSDFIAKPCEPEELAQKVQIAEEFLARQRELAQQAQSAQQAAFTAMSSMGEMGVVLQFMRASYLCHTPDELAAAVFEALTQYGLRGLVGIRMTSRKLCFSSTGACSPLEHSILGHAQGLERLFQLRDRLAINYPKITLLVFDLPVADPDRVGRIRDDLAILAEGAEARLQAMEVEAQRLAQASGISEAVADLSQALSGIEQMQAANRVRAMEISAKYLDQLTDAFVHLGLSEDQEAELAAMAQGVSANLDSLMEEGRFVGDLLRETTTHLSRLVEA